MTRDIVAIAYDTDRRGAARQAVDAAALTFLKGQDDPVVCRVLDISDTGARIEVGEASFLPKHFKLYIEQKHVLAECDQMWRKGNEVGVKFISVADIG